MPLASMDSCTCVQIHMTLVLAFDLLGDRESVSFDYVATCQGRPYSQHKLGNPDWTPWGKVTEKVVSKLSGKKGKAGEDNYGRIGEGGWVGSKYKYKNNVQFFNLKKIKPCFEQILYNNQKAITNNNSHYYYNNIPLTAINKSLYSMTDIS